MLLTQGWLWSWISFWSHVDPWFYQGRFPN